MGKAPAFQFYAADFLVGTSDMSNEEVGVYIRLLAASWDKGALPLDMTRLARLAGVSSVKRFTALWEAVEGKWARTRDGYVNERLEQQRAELSEFSDKQSANGKLGAKKRWARDGKPNGTAISDANDSPLAAAEPSDSSSVFDLRSSDPDLHKERADQGARASIPDGTAINRGGTYQPVNPMEPAPAWGHRRRSAPLVVNHPGCDVVAVAACARGFCVPKFLARQWRQQLDPERRDTVETDVHIRRVVAAGLDKLPPEGAIGGTTPEKFWRDVWDEFHAANAPKAASKSSGYDADAGRRTREELARKREFPTAVSE
jgi:uncharacterized protein YdaU (DUF1376 family)